MQVSVLKSDGADSGKKLDLADATFDASYNEALVHQVVTAYMAGARSGTRAQKNRSAVAGGGAKPFRQKGTGRARAGTIRSPIWRGGGKIFPACNASFEQKLNKKMYKAGMRSIVSELLRSGRMTIVDSMDVSEIKTKAVAAQLQAMGKTDVLIVSETPSEALILSVRNIRNVEVVDLTGLNPYSLLQHSDIIMTADAASKLEEVLV
ncbi:MAG: 50S ribosomal protein L4 [Gammaproteobacteria bacterium]|nr:MAG: 50S ribosomal protein L4 [Gammaproteobacteria bacterium]